MFPRDSAMKGKLQAQLILSHPVQIRSGRTGRFRRAGNENYIDVKVWDG